jgi:hypothetical protein
MPSVINLPRIAVKEWKGSPLKKMADNTIWIAIGEPEGTYEEVTNPILDVLPKLHLCFWDLTAPVSAIGQAQGTLLYPPDYHDARQIVDFILQHKGKHVLVNCAAGVSRSGAVAQFCHDMLGYDWMDMGRRAAAPNSVLYRKMVDYYLSFNDVPYRTIDKRTRITDEIKPDDILK